MASGTAGHTTRMLFHMNARRQLVTMLIASCVLATGCSDSDDPADDSTPGTLADEEVVGQAPQSGDDVGNGSGEGGNQSDNDPGSSAAP